MANEGRDRDPQQQQQQQQQQKQQQQHGSASPQGHSPDDGARRDGRGPSARNTQGNLGTTQREWVGRDYAADSDEEPT